MRIAATIEGHGRDYKNDLRYLIANVLGKFAEKPFTPSPLWLSLLVSNRIDIVTLSKQTRTYSMPVMCLPRRMLRDPPGVLAIINRTVSGEH